MDDNEIKSVKSGPEDTYEKLKQEHRFSVTDSWYELLAVIFMLVYVIAKTCFFIFDGGYTRGCMATVGFILDLILAVFVVCTFCAVVEVQEKADITNFNMGLMAKSLHDYYHDIADRLDELAGYEPYEDADGQETETSDKAFDKTSDNAAKTEEKNNK